MDVTALLWEPAADAFLQVGVFVGVLVAGFGWLQWRHGERISALLQERRWWAPAVGALLGVSPGCAGAILVMPLYARGTVSFGTVIAALVATMGDSSWVIMAADPKMALVVHGILLATGLLCGYAVDALGIAPTLRPGNRPAAVGPDARRRSGPPAAGAAVGVLRPAVPTSGVLRSAVPPTLPAAVGAARSALARVGGAAPAIGAFWALSAAGILLAVPVGFRLVDVASVTAAGVNLYLVVGVAGTAAAFLVAAGDARQSVSRAALTGCCDAPDRFPAVLRRGARDTAFVIVWVAAIYAGWAILQATTGFDGSQLPLVGVAGVVVGALVGLIPGCAVQIVFTGLFIAGIVPLPTLVANAISQDGDALLPLLALENRSALFATVVTTVPALLVGLLTLAVV